MPVCFFLACHKLTSDLGFGILISRQHKNDLSVEKNNIVELIHGFPEIRKQAETSKKFLASKKKKNQSTYGNLVLLLGRKKLIVVKRN
mgnify:CR=1 FL=1